MATLVEMRGGDMSGSLRRGMAFVGAFLVIAAVVWWVRPEPVRVDFGEIRRGPLTITVRDEGMTRIRERFEVSTPLAGRLLRITLDVGDPVVAEQTILARMEPTLPSLLDPREVAAAEARVRAAERRLEVAKLRYDTARVEAEHAESERVRLYQLKSKDAVADAELDRAELQARLFAHAYRASQYAIEISEYEYELEKSALVLTKSDSTAGPDGMELVIRAPIAGRVLRLHHENSAVIPAGTVLMEIGDPRDLEVVVDVLSRDAVRIWPGAAVLIDAWGGVQPLGGRVRYVAPSGFTKVSALGVEEQRVNVVIDLEEPAERRESLGDQFRVEAEIIVWQADSVLTIPTAALFRGDQNWAAFVVRNGLAELRNLEIGQMNDSLAEVVSGLEPGEIVVVYPSDRVRHGARVVRREG